MNNLDLEKALVSAVVREREAAALVLRLLREVEKRELYLERGYSSLFAYCRGHLGYSEPEAMLRIQAMRLMRRVPEVEKKIEKGELSMSVASLVQTKTKELEKEAAKEIVREVEGKSKREAERTLAGFFPEEPRKEKTRAVTEELTEIRFTVNKEELELLQKLLDRKSHSNF